MANYPAEYLFTIVDVNGDQANVRIHTLQADTRTFAQMVTTTNTLATALIACSNGKIIRQGFSVLVNEAQLIVGTTPPTDAEYSSVTDGARLQFANALGERGSLTIPAPLEADFGAASNVVDPTNANVAALIALLQTDMVGDSGTALNLYKGGIKVGRRARRRRSSLVP